MKEFPEVFFQTQERWGFRVSEVMKRTWAAQLEVLWKIEEICKKYGLTYYMYWGSLIGTVRHQGYIPWDDDIDIAMKRDDYLKFLEVAREELPESYVLLNMYTDNTYTNYFTTISNDRTFHFDQEWLEEYHGCPFAIGLDIFPLYYIPRNEEEARIQKEILISIGQTSSLVEKQRVLLEAGEYTEELQQLNAQIVQRLVELQNATGFQFDLEQNLAVQLTILYDQVCQLYTEEDSDYITAFPNYLERGYKMKIEELDAITMPYEGFQVTAPNGYDHILRMTFGEYMQPVRGTTAHDYPYFKSQMQMLGRRIEVLHIKAKQTQEKQEIQVYGAKKKILYYTSVADLVINCGYAADKLRQNLAIFRVNQDIQLWWYVSDLTPEELPIVATIAPTFLAEYNEIINEMRQQDWLILDESGDCERAVKTCDAFYGDQGILAELFQSTGKPMMYQNYELLEN